MRKRVFSVMIGVLLVAAYGNIATAGGDTKLKYKGVFTTWAQSQHDFLFGNETKPEYNDNYVVQMLRMNLDFAASEAVHAITRFDLAQGWWGVDNADRTVNRTGKIGGSSLFDFKDTNFLFHVDQAYMVFDFPDIPVKARVGRMWYGVGNKLILDNNLDGVQFTIKDKLHLGYAKVSEGADGLSDVEIVDDDGNVISDPHDANLFTGQWKNQVDSFSYEAFALYYQDNGDGDGTTYMPNDINYFRSPFTPQLSELTAFGLAGNYENKEKSLTVAGEVNLLNGKDDVENSAIDSNRLVDVNDGDLSGYNVFLKANKDVGEKFNVGGAFGMGSGDDDLAGGDGNVNKLRTSGFFYVTEIWEDSIMPDEEGITPQGLGAPNVRGYRELENTTLFQFNGLYKFSPQVSLFGSYTILKATEPIPTWSVKTDNGGTPDDPDDDTSWTELGTETSDDIGQEIDWKLVWKIYPNLVFAFRGGFFMPGDGAGNLINGTSLYDETAWEHKTTITLKF